MSKENTHLQQIKIWEKEHEHPLAFKQMDEEKPSGGVIAFNDFLKSHSVNSSFGLEICCGKGRNTLCLSAQGHHMSGFDFSSHAIKVAVERGKSKSVSTLLSVADATKSWKYQDNSFNFVIDCFGSCDIESDGGRLFAVKETLRVLKPGGYFFVSTLSPNDEYHTKSGIYKPTQHKNLFCHLKTGKLERAFDPEEMIEMYKVFKIIRWKKFLKNLNTLEKTTTVLIIIAFFKNLRLHFLLAPIPPTVYTTRHAYRR